MAFSWKSTFRWIPESLSWLDSTRRQGDVLKTLQTIGRINGTEFDDIFLEFSTTESKQDSIEVSDLFKGKPIRKNTFMIIIVW